MLTSTKCTLNYFNYNLFSQKKSGVALVISEAGKESDSEEEEILQALCQPDMDQEMEINTSLEDNGESMSTTLMPLPTLRVIRAGSPPAARHNYIEVNSDDKPHSTNIFATSSDDEPASIAAIIANTLECRSSPLRKRKRKRKRKGQQETGGEGTHSGTQVKGGAKGASGSADNAPATKKVPGGRQLHSQVQVSPVDADTMPGAAEEVYDLDEMLEEDLEYGFNFKFIIPLAGFPDNFKFMCWHYNKQK
ncbi:hypothetical protein ARMGADRAFT_1039210 [Armillaria gallica]|uniref:Uncharacterized protein n=1 Tax=Armillaria gallica TaxID=47427 RepID=A0A2H3CEZ0_ARMGA|nr:hypothetical protein ARMGADRAFT_1039210 [Armillaria gallica]